jgi:hypothetical protein
MKATLATFGLIFTDVVTKFETIASGAGAAMCIGLAANAWPWPISASINPTTPATASLRKLDAVRVATATNCHRDRSTIQKAPPSDFDHAGVSAYAIRTEILSFDFSTKCLG